MGDLAPKVELITDNNHNNICSLEYSSSTYCELESSPCGHYDYPDEVFEEEYYTNDDDDDIDIDRIIAEVTSLDREKASREEHCGNDQDIRNTELKHCTDKKSLTMFALPDVGGESMSSLSSDTDDSWSDCECKDDFDWDDYTPLSTLSGELESLREMSEMCNEEVRQDDEDYQSVKLGDNVYHIDLKITKKYSGIISYGGKLETTNQTDIFTISGHDLPARERNSPHYVYAMENLFLHAVVTVDVLSNRDYALVYFCGRSRKTLPPMWWLKKMYAILDRGLRKNVANIYVVHPTFWVKTALRLFQPFTNGKLIHKIKMVDGLNELRKLLPTDYMYIPQESKDFDEELRMARSGTVAVKTT
ncbi:protein prune homolog 2-like [Saccoglossus kowalevskii]|uniref:Protein prune homolog 2-like n=1 Tax=Saccoglossus kowalevskii TaxID=10224 RepID=A0ABM0MFP8_SACKO|nr:PREDICTED: protein prune homolog 2-like [Saccoglossus kowalevskii]